METEQQGASVLPQPFLAQGTVLISAHLGTAKLMIHQVLTVEVTPPESA